MSDMVWCDGGVVVCSYIMEKILCAGVTNGGVVTLAFGVKEVCSYTTGGRAQAHNTNI
jgi:hypothetical protein